MRKGSSKYNLPTALEFESIRATREGDFLGVKVYGLEDQPGVHRRVAKGKYPAAFQALFGGNRIWLVRFQSLEIELLQAGLLVPSALKQRPAEPVAADPAGSEIEALEREIGARAEAGQGYGDLLARLQRLHGNGSDSDNPPAEPQEPEETFLPGLEPEVVAPSSEPVQEPLTAAELLAQQQGKPAASKVHHHA